MDSSPVPESTHGCVGFSVTGDRPGPGVPGGGSRELEPGDVGRSAGRDRRKCSFDLALFQTLLSGLVSEERRPVSLTLPPRSS